MGKLEIFDRCPGDICLVSWSYLIGAWTKLFGVLQIFDWWIRDIWSVSGRYL